MATDPTSLLIAAMALGVATSWSTIVGLAAMTCYEPESEHKGTYMFMGVVGITVAPAALIACIVFVGRAILAVGR